MAVTPTNDQSLDQWAYFDEETSSLSQRLARDSLGDEYQSNQTTPADLQQTQTALEKPVEPEQPLAVEAKSRVTQRSFLLDVINTRLMTNERASMLLLPSEIESRRSAANLIQIPGAQSHDSIHEEYIQEVFEVREKLTPLRNALLLLILQMAAIFLGACVLTGFQAIHEWLSGDLAEGRLIPVIALHELVLAFLITST